jgi:putative ABC transport system permease protein
VAVIAIALVIAIGTGVFAGLRSTSTWRRESNDVSFALTAIHDLRAELGAGTYVAEGTLLDAVAALDAADAVTAVRERLVVASQVDASTADETILVQARLVGMTFGAATRPVVSSTTFGSATGRCRGPARWPSKPSSPTSTTCRPRAVSPWPVADPFPTSVSVRGPKTSTSPGRKGRSSPRATSPSSTRRWPPVLTLAAGTDVAAVQAELQAVLDALPGVGATVGDRDDVDAYRLLYDDIQNDEQIWTMISVLVLFAAALAAFNLVSRIVEAQRREIGIGMALGLPRSRLAVRPLLVGAQIGIVGTVAGIGVGLLLGWAMKGLFESFLPLPEWRTPFQFDVYAGAATLGLAIPILAAALPVWRAVRVEPIQAIRTGHLAARTSRLTDWTNRLSLPGSTLNHMSIRNVLRTPRRTILTAVGVGAAITALVAVLGMLDSFGRSIDEGGEELTKGDPDRVVVTLDGFPAVDDPVITAIAGADAVGRADPGLRLGAVALAADPEDDIELLLELVDLEEAGWTPTIVDGDAGAGLILARKAADDLGVRPGDTVRIRHLALGATGPMLSESDVRVDAIHPNPIRNFAFADLSLAEEFGLAGTVNLVNAYPAEGATRGDVQRAVFDLDGVTSAQAVARFAEIFDEALEQFVGFLFVTAGFVLVLALLIAFNSSRITVEERRREHATMQAFGLPVRTVMGVVVKESVVVGVAATVIGLATGTLILGWMLRTLAASSLPDLGISVYLSPTTLLLALVTGVVTVAVAPLFLIRGLRRMNLPDTLRVME